MIKDWSTSGNMTKEDRIWYTIFSGIFQYILPLGKDLCKPLRVCETFEICRKYDYFSFFLSLLSFHVVSQSSR